MRLFVQVLLNLIYGFRYRTVATLFLESFQAGEKPVGNQALFFVDLPDVLFMGCSDLLDLLLELFRLF